MEPIQRGFGLSDAQLGLDVCGPGTAGQTRQADLVERAGQKSFSNASLPIVACSSFKSTASAAVVPAPKTPAAGVGSWFFQSTI